MACLTSQRTGHKTTMFAIDIVQLGLESGVTRCVVSRPLGHPQAEMSLDGASLDIRIAASVPPHSVHTLSLSLCLSLSLAAVART